MKGLSIGRQSRVRQPSANGATSHAMPTDQPHSKSATVRMAMCVCCIGGAQSKAELNVGIVMKLNI